MTSAKAGGMACEPLTIGDNNLRLDVVFFWGSQTLEVSR